MRDGHNQYAPMPGVLALREGIAAKVEQLYGARYDAATEVLITSGATAGAVRDAHRRSCSRATRWCCSSRATTRTCR